MLIFSFFSFNFAMVVFGDFFGASEYAYSGSFYRNPLLIIFGNYSFFSFYYSGHGLNHL